MRPSMLSRNSQAYRTCRASARPRFTASASKTEAPLSPLCQICHRTPPRRSERQVHQRWASQRTSTTSTLETSTESNPIPDTHYGLFPQTLSSGPPPSGPFVIDTRQLRKEFLQLQAVAHPDRHPAALKTRAEATSARINEAYKTLQNPLLRAQYLLSLKGINIAEDEAAKVDDPELLMDVLDAREEIENAAEEKELEGMKSVNDERIAVSERVLDEAFMEDDMATAKQEAVRLRYWVNIKESLDAWEKGKPVVVVH